MKPACHMACHTCQCELDDELILAIHAKSGHRVSMQSLEGPRTVIGGGEKIRSGGVGKEELPGVGKEELPGVGKEVVKGKLVQ